MFDQGCIKTGMTFELRILLGTQNECSGTDLRKLRYPQKLHEYS